MQFDEVLMVVLVLILKAGILVCVHGDERCVINGDEKYFLMMVIKGEGMVLLHVMKMMCGVECGFSVLQKNVMCIGFRRRLWIIVVS